MPVPRSDSQFRPAVEADLERVFPLIRADPASVLTLEAFHERFSAGQYRLPWIWLAEDGETARLLALALWWGTAQESKPGALDAVYVDESVDSGEERTALAADLLTAAHASFAAAPDYHVFVPGDWTSDPEVVGHLEWRREAVRRAGLTSELERLRYEWRPEYGLPASSGRLRFVAEPDDEVFVALFAGVIEGSLDAASTVAAAETSVEECAREDVAFYREVMVGDRAWWRLAVDGEGRTVGFGLPSRNPSADVVGYLGVLPEHRGRGYVADILAEITRILAEEAGTELIRADTDLGNAPMAAAFDWAGYRNFSRRLVYSAPPADQDS